MSGGRPDHLSDHGHNSTAAGRHLWWAVWKAIVAASALAVALFVGVLWLYQFPTVQRDRSVSATTLFSLARIVLLVVAGVGGVVALVVAYRRQHNGEAENRRAEVRLFVERFAKASELLGHDRAAVRLAAVHSLAGLADDWSGGRQTCVDVLCAYLRMPFTSPASYPPQQALEKQAAQQELLVRQTIIRIVGGHLVPGAPRRWDSVVVDLAGAAIDGGDLRGIRLGPGVRLSLREARLRAGTLDLSAATFAGGTLDLSGAVFAGGVVDLSGAVIDGGAGPADLLLPVAVPDGLRLPGWAPRG